MREAVARFADKVAMPALPRSPESKLPPVVLLLALGTFLMCTTEFMIAGLLPQMADDFGVRPSHVGLLITAFAIGMIVGAPVMAVATLRLPKRATLVLALATFAAGPLIAALSGPLSPFLPPPLPTPPGPRGVSPGAAA